jgi:hypothetical protein
MTFHACSSPAPTRVKSQPAPAILSQESVHTTLSITHHTRKRPSTGPRTTHGPHNTNARGGANLHITRKLQMAAMQATYHGKSLNVGLTSRAAITSPSSPALPHTRLNPRHSSTLYDERGPRLRLGRGRLGKHSGRPRQTQTTRGEGQASRKEQSNPATRWLSLQGIATRLQCILMDGDVRRDMPVSQHCNSIFYFLLYPSPYDYKRERREKVTRVRLSYDQTPPTGTWEQSPSPG